MKPIKTVLYLTLPMTLFLLLACQRVYPDGHTQDISWYQATYDVIFGKPPRKEIDLKTVEKTGDSVVDAKVKAAIEKHNKGAQSDREDPDNGLIPLLGIISTAGGFGWARTFLTKRNAEAARDLATEEKREAQVRYQAAKDIVREKDTDMLDKIKELAGVAARTVKEQKHIYDEHEDDIKGVRAAYSRLFRKNS